MYSITHLRLQKEKQQIHLYHSPGIQRSCSIFFSFSYIKLRSLQQTTLRKIVLHSHITKGSCI